MSDAGGLLFSADLVEHAVPHDLDLGVAEQALLQDALGAEMVAAVNHGYLRGEVGEVECLLDGRIAAADDDHLLAPVEEPVAGGAGGDTVALELLFRRHAEPLGLGAGGDDEGITGVVAAAVAFEAERAAGDIHLDDMVGDHARADMLGLRLHLFHQPGALDRVLEAGIILDVRRDHELSAGFEAGNQHRLQHGAGRIDRSGVAGRAGADDHQTGVQGGILVGHENLQRRATGAPCSPGGRL